VSFLQILKANERMQCTFSCNAQPEHIITQVQMYV